ncbi:hypothetical protein BN1221_01791 [Brenneria goodwinii]|uniref:Uncharacterized protein n=1 Tax=Brenneria goodwinii TaxID=1109412 RepID=A0A0G4JTZ8_9GAMM|nr:hypothetical protein BN1221_01791 [Brenneria goodwinii]
MVGAASQPKCFPAAAVYPAGCCCATFNITPDDFLPRIDAVCCFMLM